MSEFCTDSLRGHVLFGVENILAVDLDIQGSTQFILIG